jgi:DNA-binding NarL/FixJ family response regulator
MNENAMGGAFMSGRHNIRVLVVERDIFARQAITSYLSWDRNTRVVESVATMKEMITALKVSPYESYLDVVILDTTLVADPASLGELVALIGDLSPGTCVICLTHHPDCAAVLSARDAGACAYLVREQVGIGIAPAVRFAIRHEFVVTRDVIPLLADTLGDDLFHVSALPGRRSYPRLTQRIEQALWLCVVEGLPAERAAEEMGVSTSTIRSYIKEGYRILEAADDTTYPTSMSPAERAFLRYSALDMPHTLPESHLFWEPAA